MVQKITTALAVAFSATLVTATAIDRRIVGGEDAEEGQFPSLVRVYPMVPTRLDGTSRKFCGGTLIDSTTVLTAAHCFGLREAVACRADPEECKGLAFDVRAGSLVNTLPFHSSDFSSQLPMWRKHLVNHKMLINHKLITMQNRDSGGIVARAANLTVHPGYTGKNTIPEGLGREYGVFLDDIAILKLATPIEENGETIRYASLPEGGTDPEANSKATVAGW